MIPALSTAFPAYTDFAPAVPVRCVTPQHSGAIHRFYDSSPFSPSGRLLALTRLPFEDRLPRPGEAAEVLVVDLESGDTRVVATTHGWDTQLGAQVQWGADDRCLHYNDVDTATWRPYGVRLDPVTGERQRLGGTVYAVSPDGRWSASPCLLRTGITQRGYGVVVPPASVPANRGAPANDGITLTDLCTGASRLLVSMADIARDAAAEFGRTEYRRSDFLGFHVKWNPQGTRLLYVLRCLPHSLLPWKRRKSHALKNVVTLQADGSGSRVAVSAEQWARGGHHPNWCPDGEHVLMNLNATGDGLRFYRVRRDGTQGEVLAPTVTASGHPTLHPDGRHVLTDAYPDEPVAFGDGTAPLRWIDIDSGSETTLVRIRTQPPHGSASGALRVDPHPAWDRSFRRIAFNACPTGRRQVFVADLDALTAG